MRVERAEVTAVMVETMELLLPVVVVALWHGRWSYHAMHHAACLYSAMMMMVMAGYSMSLFRVKW